MKQGWIVALGLVAGCSSTVVIGDPTLLVADIPATPNPDLDILFVVDNSPSMADKQQSLAANFPQMMDVLGTLDGGLPNLHVGVVSSDMGTSTTMGTGPEGVGTVGQRGSCQGSGDAGALQHASPDVLDAFISDVVDPATGASSRPRR